MSRHLPLAQNDLQYGSLLAVPEALHPCQHHCCCCCCCCCYQVTRNPLDPLRHTLYYLRTSDVIHEETPSEVLEAYYNTTDPLHRRAGITGAQGSGGDAPIAQPLARKTIQVAGVWCMFPPRYARFT
jgi:hypothetical protein